MNGVAYKTKELEVASFLEVRGHRLLSARLDGNVVAFDFNGDTVPHVESRAPALKPQKGNPGNVHQHDPVHNSQLFLGFQGRSPWLLAVLVLKKGQDELFMSAQIIQKVFAIPRRSMFCRPLLSGSRIACAANCSRRNAASLH